MTVRLVLWQVTQVQTRIIAEGVALGDLDGDGDLDAFVANDVLKP